MPTYLFTQTQQEHDDPDYPYPPGIVAALFEHHGCRATVGKTYESNGCVVTEICVFGRGQKDRADMAAADMTSPHFGLRLVRKRAN